MNIRIFPSDHELNEAGAGIITGMVQTNPRCTLGLATGGTPVGIYEELARSFKRSIVSFRHVTTFNLDEYVGLPVTHPESYRHYMNHHLFSRIDLPLEQTYLPDGNAPDLQEECKRYDRQLEKSGQLDLQLLGIGHNGHIGFNEPDHALLSGTHVVSLKEETRRANARFFNSMEEVPAQAITMGVGTILKAKTILLVVRGKDKADIIHRALTGPITTACPASLLQAHSHVTVLLDSEAGRLFR